MSNFTEKNITRFQAKDYISIISDIFVTVAMSVTHQRIIDITLHITLYMNNLINYILPQIIIKKCPRNNYYTNEIVQVALRNVLLATC